MNSVADPELMEMGGEYGLWWALPSRKKPKGEQAKRKNSGSLVRPTFNRMFNIQHRRSSSLPKTLPTMLMAAMGSGD